MPEQRTGTRHRALTKLRHQNRRLAHFKDAGNDQIRGRQLDTGGRTRWQREHERYLVLS